MVSFLKKSGDASSGQPALSLSPTPPVGVFPVLAGAFGDEAFGGVEPESGGTSGDHDGAASEAVGHDRALSGAVRIWCRSGRFLGGQVAHGVNTIRPRNPPAASA